MARQRPKDNLRTSSSGTDGYALSFPDGFDYRPGYYNREQQEALLAEIRLLLTAAAPVSANDAEVRCSFERTHEQCRQVRLGDGP